VKRRERQFLDRFASSPRQSAELSDLAIIRCRAAISPQPFVGLKLDNMTTKHSHGGLVLQKINLHDGLRLFNESELLGQGPLDESRGKLAFEVEEISRRFNFEKEI
jgi:hypothetical protein